MPFDIPAVTVMRDQKPDRSRVVLTLVGPLTERQEVFPGPEMPIPDPRVLGPVDPRNVRPIFPGPDFRSTRMARTID